MKTIETLVGQPFMQALGWALIHFVWQGALVAILFAGVRSFFKHHTAGVRYAAACGALLLLLLLPLATVSLLGFSSTATMLAPHGQRSAVQLAAPPSKLVELSETQSSAATEKNNGEELPLAAQPPRHGALNGFSALLPWLVCGWLLGALVLSLKFIGGWTLTRRLRQRQTNAASRRWQEALARL